jgi:hypothetical protein
MNDREAREIQKVMVAEGLATDMDDAAHQLVDAGEINSTQHAELLSKAEAERIYG